MVPLFDFSFRFCCTSQILCKLFEPIVAPFGATFDSTIGSDFFTLQTGSKHAENKVLLFLGRKV